MSWFFLCQEMFGVQLIIRQGHFRAYLFARPINVQEIHASSRLLHQINYNHCVSFKTLISYTLYYCFCSGSFLLISLLPVNDYYAISLLSLINSHLSKDSISIIATKSLLQNHCYKIIAAKLLLDNRCTLFATSRSQTKVLVSISFTFIFLPFVCIICVLLVFGFLSHHFIFSQVNVTFCDAYFLVQFLLYFLLV